MKFQIKQIGATVLGQSIDCWYVHGNNSATKILVIAGVHGDEAEGIEIAHGLIRYLIDSDPTEQSIAIIPCLNRDGEILKLRSNYNDVDLNRNIPTRNWLPTYTNTRYKPGPFAGSEPETKAFMKVIDDFKPDMIISLHSFSESLILYGNPSEKYNPNIKSLSQLLDLKIVEKMSYDVVGSLNSLSKEINVPTLTIEAPRDDSWAGKRSNFIQSIGAFLTDL